MIKRRTALKQALIDQPRNRAEVFNAIAGQHGESVAKSAIALYDQIKDARADPDTIKKEFGLVFLITYQLCLDQLPHPPQKQAHVIRIDIDQRVHRIAT